MLAVGGLKVVLWLPYYGWNFFKHSWKDFDTWLCYIIVDTSIHTQFLICNFQNFQENQVLTLFFLQNATYLQKKWNLQIWKYKLISNVKINDVYDETKYQNLFNYA